MSQQTKPQTQKPAPVTAEELEGYARELVRAGLASSAILTAPMRSGHEIGSRHDRG